MNQAHWHLLLTHLPIVGAMAGLGTLIGALLFRSEPVKRAAMGIFIISALLAIPTFLTGEGAEETIEGIAGINEGLISRHEEWATIFIWALGSVGVFSALSLLASLRGLKIQQALSLATLVLALGTTGVSFQLGKSGGEIRHTEIRSATAQAQAERAESGNGGLSGMEEDEEED